MVGLQSVTCKLWTGLFSLVRCVVVHNSHRPPLTSSLSCVACLTQLPCCVQSRCVIGTLPPLLTYSLARAPRLRIPLCFCRTSFCFSSRLSLRKKIASTHLSCVVPSVRVTNVHISCCLYLCSLPSSNPKKGSIRFEQTSLRHS